MMTPAEETMRRWLGAGRAMAEQAIAGEPDRLADLSAFGSNPGSLAARFYVPERLAPGAALVVALHGCTQNAADYARGTGWSALAERHGFAVLLPEQRRRNNANLCFNWFRPQDIRRGGGEVESIREMIEAMVAAQRLDRRRVFVTGLSAGGAMTMAMIACYPELFAGAAVIAGMPYHCARNMLEAIDRMADRNSRRSDLMSRMAKEASAGAGPWPPLSVWQGDADRVVVPANSDHVVDQWRGVLGLDAVADAAETTKRFTRRIWRDTAGRTMIESYTIAGMDHGVPLDPGNAGCGKIGPFMLDAGICSTSVIADGWGLTGSGRTPSKLAPDASGPPRPLGIGRLVSEALRTIGLG